MSKNLTAVFVIMLIVLAGFLIYRGRQTQNQKKEASVNPQITNSAMLRGDGDFEVETFEPTYFANTTGFFAKPSGDGKFPGVVMIHENRGLRPEIRDTAKNLAKEGYMVLAVDLYQGKVVETQEEARTISSSFDQE